MGSLTTDTAFLKALQEKTDQKLREKEIEVTQYWKDRLDRLIAMKPEGIGALQLEMRKLSDTMATRITSAKKGVS